MTAALRKPSMTRDEFLDWLETQERRYEFDGFDPVPLFDPSAPVAMQGGSVNHSQTCQNIYFALRTRLADTACRALGPDVAVAVGGTVRYPDALVSCSQVEGSERILPGAVVVFEVLSPTSGRMDRIVKLREYQTVSSIRRYVLLEYLFAGLTVFERGADGQVWNATGLGRGDVLDMPEIGIAVPVDEFFEGVDLPSTAA